MASVSGKRQRLPSNSVLEHQEDLMSNLPDEIVSDILSLMSTKEAARTSIVSRRWRYLWKQTRRIEFEKSYTYSNDGSERPKFIKMVNQALESHKAPIIDQFKIKFPVGGERNRPHIDGWLNFALTKKVKILELNFHHRGYCTLVNYRLSDKFLGKYRLDSLTTLVLDYMRASGEVIEYILSSCPLLQVLKLSSVTSLVNLKVSGPTLKLKNLEIRSCHPLKYLEISAPNLVSFEYKGRMTTMSFKDVSSLVEVNFVASYACFRSNFGPPKSCYALDQVEKLMLDDSFRMFRGCPKFPTLQNLKYLKLVLDANESRSLLSLLSVVKACPVLHKLELRLYRVYQVAFLPKGMKVSKKNEFSHQHLKVFELGGFVGCVVVEELIFGLISHAVSLEKIIIDPRFIPKGPWDRQVHPFRRTQARQLKTRLPPGVDLVVL